MAKKLPLGLQDFRKIIENGFLYVDKTAYLYNLACNPGTYFLSRPRRFGKSITIATFQELFSGSRELFEGLWIYDKWDWNRKNPVLRISFTSISFQSIGLVEAIEQELRQIASKHHLNIQTQGIGSQFKELLSQLASNGKVVVLIDEYDAPIIHYLGIDLEKAIQNREILKEMYSVLKDMDPLLEFVFITGVSKFSKTGIFSGLNNLTDLSMHPDYASMLGYTQEELEFNFKEKIEETAQKMNITQAALLEKMRVWYNGYRFEENASTVYNPVSINNFFNVKKFENFWFATGTPTFLINLLKKQGIYELRFPPINPSGFESFELNNLKIEAILFQTGYLTIQSKDEDGLIQLDYPNKEVRDSMLEHLIEGFTGVYVERSASLIIRMRNAFNANDIDQVIRILQAVFAEIPYSLHEKYPEKFFHAAIHLLFTYLGIRIHSEVCTSDGRIDSMVETAHKVYILEYKLDKSPREALEQIKSKKYYRNAWELGKTIVGVGVNFSSNTKNIEDWVAEEIN
ncbi:MAG: AAA family ATPase [Bacteroidetes bacterium]|nr:AAA family ATPase [Bacteroidota bacterium]